MKMKLYSTFAAVALSAIFSASALAQDKGFYLGGSLGYSNLDESESDLQSDLTNAGLTGTIDLDDEDLGWKVFGGYNLNEYFGFEVGYLDLGEAKADFNITAPAAVTGSLNAKGDGFTVASTAAYPINEEFDVFAKLGAFFWDVEGSATLAGATITAEDDGTAVFFGLGAKYNLNNNVTLRAEWEYFPDVSGSDPYMLSVGAQYNFDLF